jgi:hypothetical protein
MTAQKTARRVFVSAPAEQPLTGLLGLLRARQLDPYVLSDVAALGAGLVDAVLGAIAQADLVICILSGEDVATNAAVEAGIALGLDKPVVVVAGEGVQLPTDLAGLLTVRADVNDVADLEAIAFALDQAGERPQERAVSQRPPRPSGRPLGAHADRLLDRAWSLSDQPEQGAQALLEEAIELSGAAAVKSALPDQGFDLGVWADDLDAVAGNPLLIEVKNRISEHAVRQVLLRLHQVPGARLGLLVHLDAASPSEVPGLNYPILAICLTELLERMRTRSFAQVVRDLRNEAVHGRPKPR